MTPLEFRKNESPTNNIWEFLVSLASHSVIFHPVFFFYTKKRLMKTWGFFSPVGPIIKAEVGEQIVITFKNKASRPYSITPYGVKASGAHVPVKPGEKNDAVAGVFSVLSFSEAVALIIVCLYSLVFRLHIRVDVGCSKKLWSRGLRS